MVNLNSIKSLNDFFVEWKTHREITQIMAGPTLVLILLAFWLQVSYANLGLLQESAIANFFVFMLFFGSLLAVINFVAEKNRMVSFLFWGKDWTTAIIATVIGIFTGVLFSSGSFMIANPLSLGSPISETFLAFIFVVVLAPYAEEKFFRWGVYPTVIEIFDGLFGRVTAGIISILLTSGAFAFFHYVAYNASVPLMMMAFVFSIIVIVGNRFLKSVGFGFGLHLTVNWISWFALYGGF